MGCGCNKNKGRKPQQMATSKGFTNPNKVEPVKEQPSKEGPSLLQKALNFGEAIVDHVADGMTKVDKNELSARLTICSKCPHNVDGVCNQCGCVLSTKATWRSSDCPKGFWPNTKTV